MHTHYTLHHADKISTSSYSHTNRHTHTHTPSLLFILRACPPWQEMEMQSKLWSVGERRGDRGAVGTAPDVSVCVRLRWCDISGLTWSGSLPPRAWRELPGKDTDGGLGSLGGGGISRCEQKAPCAVAETTCKNTSWSLLATCFMLFSILSKRKKEFIWTYLCLFVRRINIKKYV